MNSLLIQLKPHIFSKWDQFARAIGVSDTLLQDLYKQDPETRLVEMLDHWLWNSKPTWRDVAKALEGIHLYQLAADILKVYETGE